MGLTDTLRAQAGPLPVWAWGAVVIGGFAVYKIVSGSSGGSSSSSGTGTSSNGGSLPSSGILDTGVGGQTIQNISNPAPDWKTIFAGVRARVARIQSYKDAIAALNARIAKLKAIPAGRRTAAQKTALAAAEAQLKKDKDLLASAEAALSSYEAGINSGSGGSAASGVAASVQTTTSQIAAPSVAVDFTSRFGASSGGYKILPGTMTPPTFTSQQASGATKTAPTTGR